MRTQEGGGNLLPVFLVDTATDVTLLEVTPGATYQFTQAQLDVMGLYAEVPSGHPLDGQVESVVLSLDGGATQTENNPPYALFSDNSGDFFPGSIPAGAHTLTMDLYSANSAQGTLLDTQIVSFQLVGDNFPPPEDPSLVGQWSPVKNWPVRTVHAILLPTGKVMFWAHPTRQPIYLWDPETDLVSQAASHPEDLYCSGHAFLPDGRLLVSGGHIENRFGLNTAAIYDPYTDSWTDVPNMNNGRWYPSSTTLANGDVLVVSGDITNNQKNELPEIFELDQTDWRGLSSAGVSIRNYPRTFLAPDGRVFFATRQSLYLDTSGTGSWTNGAVKNVNSDSYGSAVMYEPGKILWTGGGKPPTATCEIIDLNDSVPSWQFADSMTLPRRQNNVTLLPDGKVLATGGSSDPGFNDESGAVLFAEMWDPSDDIWTIMASHQEYRGYHSTALLLPDGKVLNSGGDGHNTAEVYSPPYLFAGIRPTITSAPASISYGQTFLVETADTTEIDKVRILRNGSATHGQNWDQRVCSLEFAIDSLNVETTEAQLSVTGPASATDCPPGPYMLFVLNSSGVPSVAEMVLLPVDTTPRLLTVSKSGSGNGAVTSNPGGIDCGGDCTEGYVSGTSVTLTAAPATGSTFDGWSGACNGTGGCLVTMTVARSVTATFSQIPPNLTVSVNGSGSVTSNPVGIDCGADCSEPYNDDTLVTLTATAGNGWQFDGWSGICTGAGA